MMKRLVSAALLCGILLCGMAGLSGGPASGEADIFHILLSEDMRDTEPMLQSFAEGRFAVDFAYEGISDVIRILQNDTSHYDAVWLSSTIWLEMKSGGQRISGAKITSINPVVFAMSMDKAELLGFVGNDHITIRDILDAVQHKGLRFLLPSVTQTDSGAAMYLSMLTVLAGSPETLLVEDLDDPALQQALSTLFGGVERSSGSEAFVTELAQTGQYDCIVSTEHSVITMNRALVAQGKEPFYLLYPVDGISLSDAPFAYIDHGDVQKKEQFAALQDYILSPQGQDALARLGRRTGYGGLIDEAYADIFNADWGIASDAYLYPVKYPARAVVDRALSMYQAELRKPSVTAFCLDFSGSMNTRIGGETGHRQLVEALTYILDPAQAEQDYIQFTSQDFVLAYGFTDVVAIEYGTCPGDETLALLDRVRQSRPGGGTNIYLPIRQALLDLGTYDPMAYTRSIVLMTDGDSMGDIGSLSIFYRENGDGIPVYSILFGEARPAQLEEIAGLTGGMVFDGRSTTGDPEALIKAFRTIRGYN